ncbi:MAG: PilZ domain-containing protein [Blastocatellia bacterium]
MTDRQHERIPLMVEVVLESSAGKRPSRISDLSLGGCYVESITSFREGEPVSFDVNHATVGTVKFTGNVAYVLDGFGFGLRFTNVGPQQLEFLHQSLPVSKEDLLELW